MCVLSYSIVGITYYIRSLDRLPSADLCSLFRAAGARHPPVHHFAAALCGSVAEL